jgi:hypothetical protein
LSCRKISRKVKRLETTTPQNFLFTKKKKKKKKKKLDEVLEEAQLKALVELVVEFTLTPENPAWIVDAMFTQTPALKVRCCRRN